MQVSLACLKLIDQLALLSHLVLEFLGRGRYPLFEDFICSFSGVQLNGLLRNRPTRCLHVLDSVLKHLFHLAMLFPFVLELLSQVVYCFILAASCALALRQFVKVDPSTAKFWTTLGGHRARLQSDIVEEQLLVDDADRSHTVIVNDAVATVQALFSAPFYHVLRLPY